MVSAESRFLRTFLSFLFVNQIKDNILFFPCSYRLEAGLPITFLFLRIFTDIREHLDFSLPPFLNIGKKYIDITYAGWQEGEG